MKGKILHYNPQERTGIITGENNQRYDFISSEIRTQGIKLVQGMSVDFIVDEYGNAMEIYLPDEQPRQKSSSASQVNTAQRVQPLKPKMNVAPWFLSILYTPFIFLAFGSFRGSFGTGYYPESGQQLSWFDATLADWEWDKLYIHNLIRKCAVSVGDVWIDAWYVIILTLIVMIAFFSFLKPVFDFTEKNITYGKMGNKTFVFGNLQLGSALTVLLFTPTTVLSIFIISQFIPIVYIVFLEINFMVFPILAGIALYAFKGITVKAVGSENDVPEKKYTTFNRWLMIGILFPSIYIFSASLSNPLLYKIAGIYTESILPVIIIASGITLALVIKFGNVISIKFPKGSN